MAGNYKDVTVEWKGDLVFDATAESGASVRMASGEFSPMDMVLGGLAGCSGMDVIDILRKKRQIVTDFQVVAHGERAADHPRKYIAFHLKYIITGQNVDEQAVKRAIELSDTKYCSVLATLRAAGPVITDYEIRPATNDEVATELALIG